jgi:hypothetical protein
MARKAAKPKGGVVEFLFNFSISLVTINEAMTS